MRVIFAVIFGLGCGMVVADEEEADKWEKDIAAFEAKDAAAAPQPGGVLFIGSSSVRKWKLGESFPGLEAVNRGFGGSQIADSVRYFERVVVPHAPRAIVLYAGDNDMNKGKTPEDVLEDYVAFVETVRGALPQAEVVFIAIKPSRKRWSLWPEMRVANALVRGFARSDAKLHFADIAAPMVKGASEAEGPGVEWFEEDGLHLSPEGYRRWSAVVAPLIGAEVADAPPAGEAEVPEGPAGGAGEGL